MTNIQIKTIAVLGTGAMGAPMARNIAKRGLSVRVWNRNAEKAAALAGPGIDVAASVDEAVRDADVILTMLVDGPAVLSTMRAAGKSLRPGTIWLQMSTVGTRATAELAAFAERHSLVLVDAPVQGSRQPAEQGQLVILAAGPAAVRERVAPVFDAVGKRTVWVSEDAASGAASRLKLALNHYALTLTHAIAESLRIAQALGVDPRYVMDAVSGGPMDNGYFQMKGKAISARDFTPSFTVANAAKDAHLIADAVSDAGLRADLAAASLVRFDRAVAQGYGAKDMSASFLVD
jgi:3-hydroxyisobutyrate dehydrogenase